MVQIGSDAEKEIDDLLLTRYASYLIAQNGDTRKKQIALPKPILPYNTKKTKIFKCN